jgi:lichenan operon transcriptional antiterminator
MLIYEYIQERGEDRVDKRLHQILSILNDEKVHTTKEIAQSLDVCSRTIRNDVKILVNLLEQNGAELVTKPRVGVFVIINDVQPYEHFYHKATDDINKNVDSNQPIQYLLEYLLVNNKTYVKLDDIEDIMHVSRSSLSNYLREAKNILNEYNIHIIHRPNYGIKVDGDEFDLRLCISNVILNRLNSYEQKSSNQNRIKAIGKIVRNVIEESTLQFSDISFQALVVHIYTAILRIEDNCYVPMERIKISELRESYEFSISSKIVECLEKEFRLSIPEEEIAYISIHLASNKIIEENSSDVNVVIKQKYQTIVYHMLEAVKNSFQIDFFDDLELQMALAQHLIPFDTRIHHDIKLKNPIIKEIKQKYLLAYDIAVTASKALQNYYQKHIKDDEIGYFALHFALAFERKTHGANKKNILVVCATGRGSAELLSYKLNMEFTSYIDQIKTCDVMNVANQNLDHFHYIFTTVPITVKVNQPVVEINDFLNEKDINKIRGLFMSRNRFGSFEYFDPLLFIPYLYGDNKEQIIYEIVKSISKTRDIPSTFYEDVLKREAMGSTEFGNRVALPHPYKFETEETFICIGILDKPILWDKKKVQIVGLVSVSKHNDNSLQDFYAILAKVFLNKEYVSDIIQRRTFDNLMEIMTLKEGD